MVHATMTTTAIHNHQRQHHQPSTDDKAPQRIEIAMATAAGARDVNRLVLWYIFFILFYFYTNVYFTYVFKKTDFS